MRSAMLFSPEGSDNHEKTIPLSKEAVKMARNVSSEKRVKEADPQLMEEGLVSLEAAQQSYKNRMKAIPDASPDRRAQILNLNAAFETEVENLLENRYIGTKVAEKARKEMEEVVGECLRTSK